MPRCERDIRRYIRRQNLITKVGVDPTLRDLTPYHEACELTIPSRAERKQVVERCGGANDGSTPILGCTQEPRRNAAYCIDVVVCAQEERREKREKVGESRKSTIERKCRIGGIGTAGALLY